MRRSGALAGLIALTTLACGEDRPPLTGPSAGSVAVRDVELVAPTTIAPGQTIQLAAYLHLSDGTRVSPSPEFPVTWSTSSSLLQVTQAGVLSASQTRGEARVTVRTPGGSRAASRTIMVLPDGTFRLVGIVRDAESTTVALPGVRVEVPQAGLSTTTDALGQYLLYGVPAGAVVQVSKAGYLPISEPLQVTTHTTLDFRLALSGTRVALSGNYTLILDMPEGCAGNLNPSLRRRTYEATVTQTGGQVEIVLTEPRFRLNPANGGNRITGFADTAGITLDLDAFESYYYIYPEVAERLADNSILVPSGHAIVVPVGDGVSGGFNATFTQYDARFPSGATGVMGTCRSAATQLTLVRR